MGVGTKLAVKGSEERNTMGDDNRLRLTPKRLGKIAMGDFCPYCFWLSLRMRFRMPFDHFGGAIFKNLENTQIALVHHLLETNGKLPLQFDPLCDAVGVVDFPRNWRKFEYRLPDGTHLYGEPDDIFSLRDGSIAVVDHKTAKPKDGEETPALAPSYLLLELKHYRACELRKTPGIAGARIEDCR